MVSQLSARLLGSRITTATPSSGYTSSGSNHSSSVATGGSSGYTADISATSVAPDSIRCSERAETKHATTKRSNMMDSSAPPPSSDQPVAVKRFKTGHSPTELHYIASIARNDIERGGLVFPRFQPNRPRAISGVNLSTVSHMSSSDCKSPFLIENINNNDSHAARTDGSYNQFYLESPHDLQAMLQATSSYYRFTSENEALPASFLEVVAKLQKSTSQDQPVSNETASSSDSESSTSSCTISDTGINNKVNSDHVVSSDCPKRSSAGTTQEETRMHTTTTDIIPIGKALAISRRPRIITSAEAPYHVVQVNAAFLRLTNSTSTARFLGQPLNEILLDDDAFQSVLHQSFTTRQKKSIPGYPNIICTHVADTSSIGSKSRHVHHISIVPVGTVQPNSLPGKVTHFVIKLREHPAATSSSSSTTSSSVAMANTNPNQHHHHHQRDTSRVVDTLNEDAINVIA